MSEARRAEGKKLGVELIDAIQRGFLSVGFDSTDDPWARHPICVKENEDGDCEKHRMSGKFRGPLSDAIAAAWIALREHHTTAFRDEVWAPDFLAERGYESQGFLSASAAK